MISHDLNDKNVGGANGLCDEGGMTSRLRFVLSAALWSALLNLPAADWTWTWQPGAGEQATAVVSPMKYGKKWGYAVELDDGGRETGMFAPGFFEQFQFTDAPPGVAGGKPMPVVGSYAVIAGSIGANSTILNWDDLRANLAKGWGVSSHSYYHKGRTYGNPPEILTPEQVREDLFWSQVIFAQEIGAGRAPTHFVYPNGYKPYSEHLPEFGLVSGSLVGGDGGNNPSQGAKLLFLPRAYLDEGAWTNPHQKGDPMSGFPADGPPEGAVMIDFTHGIDVKPDSPNQQRWKTRLETIAGKWGAGGKDEFWSAPSGELVNYAVAAKQAKVTATPGKLEVSLPDHIPGTALTIRLEGIPEDTAIPAPPGGAVYRKGTTVWLTTPVIGQPGAPAPSPAVKRIYQGPADQPVKLPRPTVKIAAVRVTQSGRPTPGVPLKVDLILPDGTRQTLGEIDQDGKSWLNGTPVISAVPNGPAIEAKGVEVTAGGKLNKEIEVWVVE